MCVLRSKLSQVLASIAVALLTSAVCGQKTLEQPDPASASLESGLSPTVLGRIVNRTEGIQPEERAAYFRVLELTRKSDDRELRVAAGHFRQYRESTQRESGNDPDEQLEVYVDIMRFPEHYVGKPVTLNGVLTRVTKVPAGENEFGFESFYETRLVTSDSRSNPAVIVTSSIPEDLPLNTDLVEQASVTGYFFKVYGYSEAGSDEIRYAPLILAKTIQWNRTADRILPKLDPELLKPIRQRTFGIPESEHDAYYRVLKLVKDGDYRQQKKFANQNLQSFRNAVPKYRDNPELPFPVFVEVFKNPDRYHGRLMTLSGHVRKLIRYPADPNDYDIETLYEAWLYTEDSQHHPAVIVTTSIPKGIPIGENVSIDDVRVSGYLFKLYGYEAGDNETRLAPMILAQRLVWTPRKEPTLSQTVWMILYAVAGLVLLLIVVFLIRTSQKDRKFRKSSLTTSENAPEPDLSGIETSNSDQPTFPTGETPG